MKVRSLFGGVEAMSGSLPGSKGGRQIDKQKTKLPQQAALNQSKYISKNKSEMQHNHALYIFFIFSSSKNLRN